MNIQKFLLLDELLPSQPPSNQSSLVQLSTNRCDPNLSSQFQIFQFKSLHSYSERMLQLYQQSSYDNKSQIYITYGSKDFVLPESLDGINELFEDEADKRQRLYRSSVECFLEGMLGIKVEGLGEGQKVEIKVRLYDEEQESEQNSYQTTISSLHQLQDTIDTIRQFKNTLQVFVTSSISIATIDQFSHPISRTQIIELSLLIKQADIEHKIIIDHILDSIYKFICKNDQATKQDCQLVSDMAGLFDASVDVFLIGYALTKKFNCTELNSIVKYFKKYNKTQNSLVKKELLLQHWKPIYTKELKENIEEQVNATRRQVIDLKNKLRQEENDVMNIWCGQLNLNKTLIFEPSIKKLINCEELKNDVAEITLMIEEYKKIQEEFEDLQGKLEEIENEEEFYGERKRPVVQSAATKKQFEQIRLLQAKIEQKERENLRLTATLQYQNISELPTLTVAPRIPPHPQSAQVRKSESKPTRSRPLTGVPPSTLSKVTSIPIFSNVPVPKGSLFNFSNVPSTRTNTQTITINNEQKALSKAYTEKFKIEKQNYLKSHESTMKNIMAVENKKIEQRKHNLKIAIFEAKKIIESQNKALVWKDSNYKNREQEEEVLKKQVENNKNIRRYSRTTLKRSLADE